MPLLGNTAVWQMGGGLPLQAKWIAPVQNFKQVPQYPVSFISSSAVHWNGPAASQTTKLPLRPGLLVMLPTFVATHVTLAWALVPPVYLAMRQTQFANTLLAGPQGAWILSRQIPSWIPDVAVDGLVGRSADAEEATQRTSPLTVEQLLERLARRGAHLAMWLGKSTYNSVRGTHKEEDELAQDAVRRVGAQDADQSVSSGFGQKLVRYTSSQARGAAHDIELGQIRDAVAAWVLVKVRKPHQNKGTRTNSSLFQILFPVRLPVAIFLTPRISRALSRAFSRPK